MDNVIVNILDGIRPILFTATSTEYKSVANGFVGICQLGGKTDIALTSSYENSILYVILDPTEKYGSNTDRINRFVNGVSKFRLQFKIGWFMGITWPGHCDNANITLVSRDDAIWFQMILTKQNNEVKLNINDLFSGRRDINLKTTNIGEWNNYYVGLCGYGPCKTLGLGLRITSDFAKLRIISADLHKIYCCIDPGAQQYCETIPEYDCDVPMNYWCALNKSNSECACINSTSLIPQCFDEKCYAHSEAYYKNKVCDKSKIDCVKIFTLVDKEHYTDDLKSVCGPYGNLYNMYLEEGRYLQYNDVYSLIEDNWITILCLSILLVIFCIVIN